MPTPRLLVEIAASIGSFQADFGKAARTADTNSRAIQRSIDDIQAKAKGAVNGLAGLFGLTLTGAGVIAGLESIKHHVEDSERSINRLEAVLTATGHAAGLTTAELNEVGKATAESSIFSPSQIREATTALLRFRDIQGDILKAAVRQVPNVASALGTDPTSAGQIIGRFLEPDVTSSTGAVKALRAAGIDLSEQQIDLANRLTETGDKAGAQRLKIELLTKALGGTGEADTKGLYGATKAASNAWGEFQTKLGERFMDDSFMRNLTREIKRWTDLAEGGTLDGSPPPSGPQNRESRGKIGGTPFPENVRVETYLAGIEQKVTQADNQQYTQLKVHLQKMADAGASFYVAQSQLQRSAIDMQQDALDAGYARGEVSTERYYATTKRLSSDALDAATEDLNRQIEAQIAIRTTKIPGTDQPAFDQNAREAALVKETALVNQANALRYGFGLRMQQLDERQRIQVEALSDAYNELFAKLEERSGRSANAAAIRFDAANRIERARIESGLSDADPSVRGDAQWAQANLKSERDQVINQGELNDAQKVYNDLIDRLGIAQGRIDIARSSGAITELDALAQTSAANRELLPILAARVEAYAAIAKDSKDPSELIKIEKLRFGLERLASQTDLVSQKFKDVFENDAVNALDEFVNGTKSAKDAFKDFTTSLSRDLTHIANQQIIKALGNALFGGADGASSGGGIALLLASLFSGGGTPGGVLAEGTDFARGGLTLVGERGPEIVNMPRGAQVIPNYMLKNRTDQGGGSKVVHTHYHKTDINVLPGATRETANQTMLGYGRALRAASRDS